MPSRKTILVDFDGTLHNYTGDFSAHLGPPLPGARHAMIILSREFNVKVFTTRDDRFAVTMWLHSHGFPALEVTNYKGRHHIILDDRAICFTGEWTDDLLARIRNFTPWWKGEGATPPLTDLSASSSKEDSPEVDELH